MVCLAPTSPARADIDPLSGVDFVRIGAVGNAPWMGNGTPGEFAVGRGRVEYEYSIGRLEVTTAQWVEFYNAAFDRPADDRLGHLIPPTFWGAVPTTPTTTGGLRWRVPAGNELRPVGNISWRMAAMYCNWLHNNKSSVRAAFLDGAYDVSTFTYNGDESFNDQLTHNVNARYWIPTWDEMLKATHYDPHKVNGDGSVGGWWVYNNGTDQPLVGGPPGVGGSQANYGWSAGGAEFLVPLGAYPQTQTPWGLLDASGGTQEWTEEPVSLSLIPGDTRMAERVTTGSFWGSSPGFSISDSIYPRGSDFPSISIYENGLRLASAVPAPSAGWAILGCVAILFNARRRKRGPNEATTLERTDAHRGDGGITDAK